jgi:hypothetical protein
LREHYIIGTSSNWSAKDTTVPPAEGEASSSAVTQDIVALPVEQIIIRFSRRAALRLRPQEDIIEVTEPTTQFPGNDQADAAAEPNQEVAAVIARLTALMEQAGPASKLIMEILVQGLEKATVCFIKVVKVSTY